jgi:hypothetical protein
VEDDDIVPVRAERTTGLALGRAPADFGVDDRLFERAA